MHGTAGATQPILPHLPQLTSLHRCHLPYCPYHRAASIRQPRGNSKCQSELRHNHSPLIPIPIKECRNVDKLIRRAKLNEEDRVAAAAKDNPKAFFAHVNNRKPVKNTIGPLKDRTGSIISNDEGMANILNEYFASVYTEEDTSEIPIVPIVYRGNNPLRKMEITVDKVKMKLKKLSSNKSAGPDGFHPRVIKETEEETAPHFCNIFRTSLEQRKAVRDWKLQIISPLFKKGSKDDPGNYSPISLTLVLGKMLESIIADDMMSHLEHNKLILDCQHGFRSGRSCLTNLVDFFHDMFGIYDKSRAVVILYSRVPIIRLSWDFAASG